MTKADFIKELAEKAGLTQAQAKKVLEVEQEIFTDVVKNKDSLTLTGFLTIKTAEAKARTAHNPRTGETIEVPAKFVPKISFSNAIKEIVKNA